MLRSLVGSEMCIRDSCVSVIDVDCFGECWFKLYFLVEFRHMLSHAARWKNLLHSLLIWLTLLTQWKLFLILIVQLPSILCTVDSIHSVYRQHECCTQYTGLLVISTACVDSAWNVAYDQTRWNALPRYHPSLVLPLRERERERDCQLLTHSQPSFLASPYSQLTRCVTASL